MLERLVTWLFTFQVSLPTVFSVGDIAVSVFRIFRTLLCL